MLRCFYDAQCGICSRFARLLARLDRSHRIELISNQDYSKLPEGIDDDIVANTIVVQDVATGRISTRSDAIAELCRALPLGTLPWLLLRFPGLHPLWDWSYDRVANNRVAISQFFGMNACEVTPRASRGPQAS